MGILYRMIHDKWDEDIDKVRNKEETKSEALEDNFSKIRISAS